MQRITIVLAVAVALLALSAGAAVAIGVKQCNSNPCTDNNKPHYIYERVGEKNDTIYGNGGNDIIDANGWSNDTDIARGGNGNDVIYVNDGDTNDEARGGGGNNNKCVVDDPAEAKANCDQVFVDPAGTQSI